MYLSASLPTIENIINSFQIIGSSVTESNNLSVIDDDFIGYENENIGLNIRYPADWVVDEVNFGSVLHIQFMSPSETNLEGFDNKVIIEVRALLLFNTLDDYVHTYTNQLMKKTPKSLNFTLLESIQIKTTSGTPVKKIIYKTSSPTGPEIRTIEAFVINDKYVYSITFGEEISKFFQYLPFVEKMIQLIKFDTVQSNETVSSITDDKSTLSVSLNLSNESLNRGEEQKISIRILDGKSNDAVPYAKVRMELFYPSGRFEKLVDNNMDENGQLLYPGIADADCETGEYALTLRGIRQWI